MTKFTKNGLAIVAVVAMAANAQAAVISVQPSIAGFFDTAFNPIPPPARAILGGTENTNAPTIVQVDVRLLVGQLSPGEDSFGHAAFSILSIGNPGELGEAGPHVNAGGWQAYPYPNVDVNGPNPPGANTPLFAQNGDLGTSSVDLVGILIQMATGAFTNGADPRRNVGEPNGVTLPSGDSLASNMLLGSAYLTWNGIGQVYISLDPVQVSAKLTNGLFIAGTAMPSAIITIGNDGTGDFDSDLDVDGRDFLRWQRGQSPNPLSSEDFADWQANFGFIYFEPNVTTAVPEPANWAMISLAAAASSSARRRHAAHRVSKLMGS